MKEKTDKKKAVKVAMLVLGMVALSAVAFAATVDYLQLSLFQKNPADWSIVANGASGNLKYGGFEFTAEKLQPDTRYTLIRYTDPWATHQAVCLGSAMSKTYQVRSMVWSNVLYTLVVHYDTYGKVNIKGTMQPGGPKVWLVLSSDVNCVTQKMTAWNPTRYLFENNLIYT